MPTRMQENSWVVLQRNVARGFDEILPQIEAEARRFNHEELRR